MIVCEPISGKLNICIYGALSSKNILRIKCSDVEGIVDDTVIGNVSLFCSAFYIM